MASIPLLMLKMMLSMLPTGILSKAVNTHWLNFLKHSFVILRAIASSSKKRFIRRNTFSTQSTSGRRAGISKSSASISSRAFAETFLHCDRSLSIKSNLLTFAFGPACANTKLKSLRMMKAKKSPLLFS